MRTIAPPCDTASRLFSSLCVLVIAVVPTKNTWSETVIQFEPISPQAARRLYIRG
jgi:hypothetical protein